MSISVAKKIRIALLVVACITFIVGIVLSKKADEKDARDLSKITAEVIGKETHFNEYEKGYTTGMYYIDLTYTIKNSGRSTWCYLEVTTFVYDKNDRNIGKIKSTFGESYGPSDLKLAPGESVKQYTQLKDNIPDDFFVTLYDSDLSDLKFECQITYGSYIK